MLPLPGVTHRPGTSSFHVGLVRGFFLLLLLLVPLLVVEPPGHDSLHQHLCCQRISGGHDAELALLFGLGVRVGPVDIRADGGVTVTYQTNLRGQS